MIEFDFSSLEAGLEKLIRAAEDAPDKVVKAMAEAILEDALERVPRDEHDLAKSGRVERRYLPDEPGVTAYAVVFGSEEVHYASAVHDGINVEVRTGELYFLRNAAMEREKIIAVATRAYQKALGL